MTTRGRRPLSGVSPMALPDGANPSGFSKRTMPLVTRITDFWCRYGVLGVNPPVSGR